MNRPAMASPGKPNVLFGMLGVKLDEGFADRRWLRWRPSVAACMQPDLPMARMELIGHSRDRALAERIAGDIVEVSPETLVRQHDVDLQDPWDFEEVFSALLDFMQDYPFDPDTENYFVQLTTGTHVAQICLFLLLEARYLPARMMQLVPPPPRPKLNRPRRREDPAPDITGSYQVIDLELARYDQLARRFARQQREDTSFLKSGINTRNPAFNRMIDRIEKVAIRSRAPVLITGPTGAGKSQLARKIFELKKRRHQVEGRFVEINCATLRGDNAMSALFGHRRGAFTGAVERRDGLLLAADRGVLFLDEIGELGLDEQAMILRAIEEKRFLPVGADREEESDFQLLAGTNRDLQQSVAEGSFREDLLARLNLWTFRLPGLRERPEDLEPNLDFELARQEEEQKVVLNREAREAWLAFATGPEGLWRANFRDLSASVTRMATLCEGGRITEQDVQEECERLSRSWRRPSSDSTILESGETDPAELDFAVLVSVMGRDRAADIDLFDRAGLAAVIRVCRNSGSLSAAGRALFACSRARKASSNDADRLRKYLARFDLQWTDLV